MKYDPTLDPFCKICGKYKGIGFCKNPNCAEFEKKGMESDSKYSEEIILSKIQNLCTICGDQAVVICGVCDQGYCESHSIGMSYSNLQYKDQHIGTCIKCQNYVCEKCWIFDTSGSILCLKHLEEKGHSANE